MRYGNTRSGFAGGRIVIHQLAKQQDEEPTGGGGGSPDTKEEKPVNGFQSCRFQSHDWQQGETGTPSISEQNWWSLQRTKKTDKLYELLNLWRRFHMHPKRSLRRHPLNITSLKQELL